MSDKNKRQSGNKSDQDKPRQREHGQSNGNSGRSETTRKEWDKIDKKGHGAGDRPKR